MARSSESHGTHDQSAEEHNRLSGVNVAELAERQRIRALFVPTEGDKEDLITYAREVASLREENRDFRTWGIIEIAVRNPNVSSYMDHWEARATTAETALTAAHRRIEELTRALEDVRAAIMEADPAVLVCTLWMPDRLSPAETVVDHIDAILASKQGGER